MTKAIYTTPTIELHAIAVETGIAASVNGFASTGSGEIIGNTDDAGNGYGSIDNGSY